MNVISKNGRITTIDTKIDHYPYPCPPSRDPKISCEQAWENYARKRGVRLVRQEESPRDAQ